MAYTTASKPAVTFGNQLLADGGGGATGGDSVTSLTATAADPDDDGNVTVTIGGAYPANSVDVVIPINVGTEPRELGAENGTLTLSQYNIDSTAQNIQFNVAADGLWGIDSTGFEDGNGLGVVEQTNEGRRGGTGTISVEANTGDAPRSWTIQIIATNSQGSDATVSQVTLTQSNVANATMNDVGSVSLGRVYELQASLISSTVFLIQPQASGGTQSVTVPAGDSVQRTSFVMPTTVSGGGNGSAITDLGIDENLAGTASNSLSIGGMRVNFVSAGNTPSTVPSGNIYFEYE